MDAAIMTMRELTATEMAFVAGGDFTWYGFFTHVAAGAIGGALMGAMVGGIGWGPGAVAGGLIGGIEYTLTSCF